MSDLSSFCKYILFLNCLSIANLLTLYWNYSMQSMRSIFISLIILTDISFVREAFLTLNFFNCFFQWNKLESKTRTSYFLHDFINREDAGMIFDWSRNWILRRSNTWFLRDILVAQTTKYITEMLLNISAIWRSSINGFSIFR